MSERIYGEVAPADQRHIIILLLLGFYDSAR